MGGKDIIFSNIQKLRKVKNISRAYRQDSMTTVGYEKLNHLLLYLYPFCGIENVYYNWWLPSFFFFFFFQKRIWFWTQHMPPCFLKGERQYSYPHTPKPLMAILSGNFLKYYNYKRCLSNNVTCLSFFVFLKNKIFVYREKEALDYYMLQWWFLFFFCVFFLNFFISSYLKKNKNSKTKLYKLTMKILP